MQVCIRAVFGLVALATALISVSAQAVVEGDAAAGKAKAVSTCAACHGADGNGGADPTWPRLAGQIPEYLVKQLKDFKSGARSNPIMAGMAAPLSDKEAKDLAVYFSSQTLTPGVATSKELAQLGGRIYRGGNAKTGVSACMSCHGPSGHGIPPRFPRVTGQNAAYTEKQLLDFKSARRKNDDSVMTRITFRMSEEEIKAVSQYMAGLH
ncbi:MAG: cytochrome c4 [Gammaproteobacteria bacterium]|nr:cytochrome c4 [Gammaproteobacteria bacterium]